MAPVVTRRSRPDELTELVGLLPGSVSRQVRKAVTTWQSWTDPRARLLRRRRRAVRATAAWGVIGGGTGTAAVVETVTGHFAVGTFGLGVLAVVSGWTAVRSGAKARRLHRTPLPEPAPQPVPLPPRGSLAREPVEQLAAAEATLHELLRQLAHPSVTSIPDESVAHARSIAAEAAAALRVVADQLQAVERARDTVAGPDRAPLEAGVRRLRAQLDAGLDGYRRLVGAAGQAVAESRAADPSAALVEATDHLAGVASALRDLPT